MSERAGFPAVAAVTAVAAGTAVTAPPALVLCGLADPGRRTHESDSPFCLRAHRARRAAGLPNVRRRGPALGAAVYRLIWRGHVGLSAR